MEKKNQRESHDVFNVLTAAEFISSGSLCPIVSSLQRALDEFNWYFFKYNGTSLVATKILQRIPFNENFTFYSKKSVIFD